MEHRNRIRKSPAANQPGRPDQVDGRASFRIVSGILTPEIDHDVIAAAAAFHPKAATLAVAA